MNCVLACWLLVSLLTVALAAMTETVGTEESFPFGELGLVSFDAVGGASLRFKQCSPLTLRFCWSSATYRLSLCC